jgi:hypothetical protein
MLIGVDFDNTIVSYDALFHRVALERGLIPESLPVNKTTVRDHLRAAGREDAWTEMQGEVYGARMHEAEPFPGVIAFFRDCHERGVPVVIISHKTRHPFRGAQHDLHAAARGWLEAHGFFSASGAALPASAVHFELTKANKLARVRAAGCTHFIDDLPELLTDAAFPIGVERLLFDPASLHAAAPDLPTVRSWSVLHGRLLPSERWSDAADALLTDALQISVGAPEPVSGGANNRVYRIPLRSGRHAIAKRYFRRAGDPRDRFGTERAFYHFAAAAGVTQIPAALGWDEAEQLGVFDCIKGTRIPSADSSHLDQALEFVSALNRARHLPEAAGLPEASEACFSIDAHLAAVRRRLAVLESLPAEDALDAEARTFVQGSLQPAWAAVEEEVQLWHAPLRRSFTLPRAERCVSPSDFGSHNALLGEHGRLVFFDFEYAGWDDPAKLVCDFFCQPDVPAPRHEFERFAASVALALDLTDPAEFLTRCRLLLPLHQLKWACILLNEFTVSGRSRRAFALGSEAAAARRSRQLTRARSMIAQPRLAAA